MAFVPDAELSNFVDSLDVKVESENLREEKSLSDTGCRDENKEDDVWEIIANAADDWSRRLVDAECLHKRSIDFRTNVENSLYRQQLDGFLSDRDTAELRYITNLWADLLNTLSSYLTGCIFLKRNVIHLLLKLHAVKQIADELFIETCLKL